MFLNKTWPGSCCDVCCFNKSMILCVCGCVGVCLCLCFKCHYPILDASCCCLEKPVGTNLLYQFYKFDCQIKCIIPQQKVFSLFYSFHLNFYNMWIIPLLDFLFKLPWIRVCNISKLLILWDLLCSNAEKQALGIWSIWPKFDIHNNRTY